LSLRRLQEGQPNAGRCLYRYNCQQRCQKSKQELFPWRQRTALLLARCRLAALRQISHLFKKTVSFPVQ
jgi:hypothetical protein